MGDSCQLTVIHDRLPDDANSEVFGGWPMILSGLKTLLETGELLDTPGSLRYSRRRPPDVPAWAPPTRGRRPGVSRRAGARPPSG